MESLMESLMEKLELMAWGDDHDKECEKSNESLKQERIKTSYSHREKLSEIYGKERQNKKLAQNKWENRNSMGCSSYHHLPIIHHHLQPYPLTSKTRLASGSDLDAKDPFTFHNHSLQMVCHSACPRQLRSRRHSAQKPSLPH